MGAPKQDKYKTKMKYKIINERLVIEPYELTATRVASSPLRSRQAENLRPHVWRSGHELCLEICKTERSKAIPTARNTPNFA